jgi:hypothetical protein
MPFSALRPALLFLFFAALLFCSRPAALHFPVHSQRGSMTPGFFVCSNVPRALRGTFFVQKAKTAPGS